MVDITTQQFTKMLFILAELSNIAEKHENRNTYRDRDDDLNITYGVCLDAKELLKNIQEA